MNNVERIHAIISGRVQGVSFRYYTQQEAQKLGITGWVMNRRDGKVEVVGEGSPQQIQQFNAFLHKGSPAAHVEQVQTFDESATGEFASFEVTYDKR